VAKFRIEIIKEFKAVIKELATGLRNLSFSDNFQSFEYNGIISANTEEKIRNQLTFKPSKYIITHQVGNALVTAGDTEWDNNFVYIKNHDATNAATIKITFLR
jgi:hypothetical protein